MIKLKATAFIAAVILAAAAVSGCGGQASAPAGQAAQASESKTTFSEPKEYMQFLRDNFKTYVSLSGELDEVQESKDFSKVSENFASIRKVFGDIRNAVPPAGYEADHKKICDGLDAEEKYVDNWQKFLGFYEKGEENLTESETAELHSVTEDMRNAEMTFGSALLETVKKIAAGEKS